MGAVGILAADVFDQFDLFQDVAGFVALVEAAVNDSEGQRPTLPDQHQAGMANSRLISRTMVANWVGHMAFVEIEGQKEIGLRIFRLVGGVEQRTGSNAGILNFLVGDLEQEIDRFPTLKKGFVAAQGAIAARIAPERPPGRCPGPGSSGFGSPRC